jgi:hypothetical protein
MLRRTLIALALLTAACGPNKLTSTLQLPTLTADGVPDKSRRGPILLHFGVSDPEHVIESLRLELKKGGAWSKATATLENDATGVRITWESFRDVEVDAVVPIRLVAETRVQPVEAYASLEVLNDPETDRLILVGQPMKELEGGGANNSGNGVGVLRWSTREGKVIGDPLRIEVGKGPVQLRAAPHGRATAIIEDTEWGVSVVATPLRPDPSESVRLLTRLDLPYGTTQSVRWSADGRYLFVLGYAEGSNPAAIWRYEPTEDLSSFGEPQVLATIPGPPSAFDVDRTTGQFLVTCGSGGVGISKVLLYAADGHEQARIEEDMDFANALAIHPAGGLALWTGSFSGELVRRFRFDATSLVEERVLTSVATPADIVFHPASPKYAGAAVIANFDSNTLTPLALTETGETVGTPVGRVPLASELDIIERGSLAGSIFSTAVTDVYRLQLQVDGTLQNKGAIHSFADATEQIVYGISVQR